MTHEKVIRGLPGLPMLFVLFADLAGAIYLISRAETGGLPYIVGAIAMFVLFSLMLPGFFLVEPNGSKVILLFGRYVGTVKEAGFHFVNPFTSRRNLSLRVRTLNGEKLKVNDSTGNPIEIAAIIVWQVDDTYEASFEVDDYENFVMLQSEAAIRHAAGTYPYDDEDEHVSLRRNSDEVSHHLRDEIQDRLRMAGVKVLESRIAHLAYAQEIAGAMLRRQQATAVISARTKIVDGAVGMVEMALERMEREGVIKLDEERKAAMVSNLMVVLCSEHGTQPVVNAGTLYA